MTKWRPLTFDPSAARAQLQEFRSFLQQRAAVGETDVCKFIQAREQLVAAIGMLQGEADAFDRWAPGVDLGGMHKCDLAVGDSRRTAYALVEFEDAGPDSIFRPQPATPYWTDRFNHGFAQIVDWLCFLDGNQMTPQFRDYWGAATPPRFVGVLVIGRNSESMGEGRQRIEWRSAKVSVNVHPVLCMTYDDLVERLLNKLNARAEPQP